MKRAFLLLLALAACDHKPRAIDAAPAAVAPTPAQPKLVVLVVVDQLPAWTWPAKSAAATDGIAKLVARGRHYTSRYPYHATQTAVGHATLATGAPPAVSGILANEWYFRDAKRELHADETPAGGPVSAANLRVDGLGDELAKERPGAHAVAVSLKSRSAIMSLGHHGLAVWYDDGCTCFHSNAEQLPPWLATLNQTQGIAPRLQEPWVASDPDRLAKLSGHGDDMPGELAMTGWTATFPHPLSATDNPAKSVVDTPLGDEIVVEAAIAAMKGEQLGTDDAADYLVVSFSAYDYVGHAFGQDSWEAWDTWLALDHQLAELEDALDAQAGAGNWALVLTSDHGAVELPEAREARGLPGHRYMYEDIAAIANKAAVGVLGDGTWIASALFPYIYLADAVPADKRDAVLAAVITALRATPGIDRAELAKDLEGHCDSRTGDDQALCESLDAERSGDIVYDPGEGTVLTKAQWHDAVSHGSLHDYDRNVPLVIVAPGVAPGEGGDASALQVAPTLAHLLRISPPPAATLPSLL